VGTTRSSSGQSAPPFALAAPVRALGSGDGSIVAVDAAGAVAVAPSPAAGAGRVVGSVSLSAGASLVDAALFSGSHAGLALDSAGALHAFGATDPELATVASGWMLPGRPVAIALGGTPRAPAGALRDGSGDGRPLGTMS